MNSNAPVGTRGAPHWEAIDTKNIPPAGRQRKRGDPLPTRPP